MTAPDDPVARVIEAAARMGVELDPKEAAAWIDAMQAEATGSVEMDIDSGIYGHRITMADVDPAGLARFRRMVSIVGFEDQPPAVTTALALSGSAAQSRVHRFPADADFFERIHIRAGTREEACRILARVMREKALATLRLPGCRLAEVKLGNWPDDGSTSAGLVRRGSPVSWTPAEVEAGWIGYRTGDGTDARLTWEAAAQDPGWCKLDWVVADAEAGSVANASNVLDVTWEAPDGEVVPLDGFLDPYFQEVYLEADSLPLFHRLVKELGADAVATYVEQLTDEVRKYAGGDHPNWGKAARRMYNIFRLTGRYAEAAYVRELFDEPVAGLYQVAALLRTLDEAHDAGDAFDPDAMVLQVDGLIMSAVNALEGRAEAEMVRRLLRVRDGVSRRAGTAGGDLEDLEAAQSDALAAVNAYFERALRGVPEIASWLDGLQRATADPAS